MIPAVYLSSKAVLRKHEEARTLVRSADFTGFDHYPRHVVGKIPKVADYLVKPESEVSADVLADNQGGAQDANAVRNVGPQVTFVLRALASTGGTEWLARPARRQHVDRLHLRPVDGGHVAEVGHVGVVVGQHRAGARVDVGHPSEFAAKQLAHRHVQAAIAAEQRSDARLCRVWCAASG